MEKQIPSDQTSDLESCFQYWALWGTEPEQRIVQGVCRRKTLKTVMSNGMGKREAGGREADTDWKVLQRLQSRGSLLCGKTERVCCRTQPSTAMTPWQKGILPHFEVLIVLHLPVEKQKITGAEGIFAEVFQNKEVNYVRCLFSRTGGMMPSEKMADCLMTRYNGRSTIDCGEGNSGCCKRKRMEL